MFALALVATLIATGGLFLVQAAGRGSADTAEFDGDLPFEPATVRFLDARRAVAVGWIRESGCGSTCSGAIQVSDDGGRSWRIVYKGATPVTDLAVHGDDLWALSKSTVLSTVLHSADGGLSWKPRKPHQRLVALSFGSATEGWGLLFDYFKYGFANTHDGAKSWVALPGPCRLPYDIHGISFPGPRVGWVFCETLAGPDWSGKQIYRTTDAGKTWELMIEIPENRPTSGPISAGGFTSQMDMRADGFGLAGMSLSSSASSEALTRDGGRTWTAVSAGSAFRGGGVASVSFVGGTMFAVTGSCIDYETCQDTLIRSTDEGATWSPVFTWPKFPAP